MQSPCICRTGSFHATLDCEGRQGSIGGELIVMTLQSKCDSLLVAAFQVQLEIA